MLFKILDYFFLDKETKNLIKINEIGKKVNYFLYKEYVSELTEKLKDIKTIEHKSKVDFYLLILESLGKSHTQSTKK